MADPLNIIFGLAWVRIHKRVQQRELICVLRWSPQMAGEFWLAGQVEFVLLKIGQDFTGSFDDRFGESGESCDLYPVAFACASLNDLA